LSLRVIDQVKRRSLKGQGVQHFIKEKHITVQACNIHAFNMLWFEKKENSAGLAENFKP
jgi:hypothetical protein